jgi:hypothetical protein
MSGAGAGTGAGALGVQQPPRVRNAGRLQALGAAPLSASMDAGGFRKAVRDAAAVERTPGIMALVRPGSLIFW